MTKRTKKNGTPKPAERFEFVGSGAREVCIAGTFNEWHPSVTPMIEMSGGKWVKELVLPPGRHEYQFVVDGRWMPDPVAMDDVANPFGGRNSVREVRA